MHQLQNKDIGMGYGTLVSLVFHNLPSLYPFSFCRNDFLYLYTYMSVCLSAMLHIMFISATKTFCYGTKKSEYANKLYTQGSLQTNFGINEMK